LCITSHIAVWAGFSAENSKRDKVEIYKQILAKALGSSDGNMFVARFIVNKE